MISDILARCFCGRLYKKYPMYAVDQSKCEMCKATEKKEYDEQQKEINNDRNVTMP